MVHLFKKGVNVTGCGGGGDGGMAIENIDVFFYKEQKGFFFTSNTLNVHMFMSSKFDQYS